jgi:exonuclease III
MIRIVAWNILQGAAKRAEQVARTLIAHSPDVVVLTEYHPTRSAGVVDRLADAGLCYRATAPAGYGFEVFVASKAPLAIIGETAITDSIGGYVEVEFPNHNFALAGVYVPVLSAVPMRQKRAFWRMLHEAARRRLNDAFMLVGDLNTGDFPMDKEKPGKPFSCTKEYRQMREIGLVEAWRAMNGDRLEFSWRSRGSGFRIDHAFVTPALQARLLAARYSHTEREERLSDHSSLILDFA